MAGIDYLKNAILHNYSVLKVISYYRRLILSDSENCSAIIGIGQIDNIVARNHLGQCYSSCLVPQQTQTPYAIKNVKELLGQCI